MSLNKLMYSQDFFILCCLISLFKKHFYKQHSRLKNFKEY